MFERILVANRGEIACRVFRTCRALGIETVAAHSDADVDARHVREADVAVRIGPAPARDSYLDADAIVDAAVAHGVDAIHPGYGFLSEKLQLIDACARAGIVFIGPHRDAIARMGSKIDSKRIARAAGVPCVPGYDGDDQTGAALADAAKAIGFPLLIKASAGGGGKGMKRVDAFAAFASQLAAARGEALAAFGDDRVLLERCVARPRHLEVQLLGDRRGGLVHLFERECSIQRNYQKLIEEAPAAHLSDVVRATLYDASLRLGRAIGYDSVGTVEFVLDAGSDVPWFLEMNTRLQVEHPVTELTVSVDGRRIDLVEQQIRAAAGDALAFDQSAIARRGWAIEARVNAEMPDEGFQASLGRVTGYAEPVAAGVRVDSGIDAASTITPHYDAMLAKVIGSGATRDAAKARLLAGLAALRVEGVRTNQALLGDVLRSVAFDRELTTRFLDETFVGGWRHRHRADDRAAAAAAWFFATRTSTSDLPLATLTGFRLTAQAGRAARCVVAVAPADDEASICEAVVTVVEAGAIVDVGTGVDVGAGIGVGTIVGSGAAVDARSIAVDADGAVRRVVRDGDGVCVVGSGREGGEATRVVDSGPGASEATSVVADVREDDEATSVVESGSEGNEAKSVVDSGLQDGKARVVDVDGRRYRVAQRRGVIELWCDGDWRSWSVMSVLDRPTTVDAAASTDSVVAAGMPGVVTKLLVAPGDPVVAGAPVAIVEAMKLLHTLLAPRDGVVGAVHVREGQTIDRGRVLLELQAAPVRAP